MNFPQRSERNSVALLLMVTGQLITEAERSKGPVSGPGVKSEFLIAEFLDQVWRLR